MNKSDAIPIVCPDGYEKYNGKTVRFKIQEGNRECLLVGKFHVKMHPDSISIEVLASFDGYTVKLDYVHLSQVAADLIQPSRAVGIDFEIPVSLSHRLPHQ